MSSKYCWAQKKRLPPRLVRNMDDLRHCYAEECPEKDEEVHSMVQAEPSQGTPMSHAHHVAAEASTTTEADSTPSRLPGVQGGGPAQAKEMQSIAQRLQSIAQQGYEASQGTPKSHGAGEDSTPSPIPSTQGGGPVPTQSFFGITVRDLTQAFGETTVSNDALEQWLQNRAPEDETAFQALLHPNEMCIGMGDKDVHNTMVAWLKEIHADSRDHLELAKDLSLASIRLFVPTPFRLAITTVAKREGWNAEALLACIVSNCGWLEAPGTRLKVEPNETWSRAPITQVMLAGDPSMRKSSLKQFVSEDLLASPDVPSEVRSRNCINGEATIKGMRSSMHSFGRAGLVSDEISTTYCTDKKQGGASVHFVDTNKLCTWLNGEPDSVATGEDCHCNSFHCCANRCCDSHSCDNHCCDAQNPVTQKYRLLNFLSIYLYHVIAFHTSIFEQTRKSNKEK